MNRRQLLLGGLSLAGAAIAAKTQAAEHHHHQHANTADSLASTSADCLQKGQICLSHTLDLLGQGQKNMADCAKRVNEMLAVCAALQSLANQNSPHLPKLAALAYDVCKQCEDACAKHHEHEVCRACGESCAACARECKKIAA